MAKVLLKSNENTVLECLRDAAYMSVTIANMLDFCTGPEESNGNQKIKAIPLFYPSVTDRVLKKIIVWLEYHYYHPLTDECDGDNNESYEDLCNWEKNFFDVGDLNVDFNREFLINIVFAAFNLHIKSLIDVGAKQIVNLNKGKNFEELRDNFKICYDFTPFKEEVVKIDSL